MTSPQWAQLWGWKSTQAAHPAKTTHAIAIGSVTARQRSVRTGCTNLTGKNIDIANRLISARINQKFGESANKTITTIFQHPGNP